MTLWPPPPHTLQVATAATLAGAAVSASSAAFGYLLDTYTSDHDAASNGRAALSRQAANAALSAVCATLDALLPALLALTFTKERFSGAMLAVCGAAASALLAVHGAVFWLGEACPLVFSVAKQPLKTSAFLISTLYSAHHVGYAADAHGAVLKWATLWGIFSAVAGGYPWLQAAALRAVAFLGGGALAAAAVGAALHVAVFAPLTVFARHMARSAATEGGLRLAAFFTPFHYVCDLGRLRLVAALALKACAAASGSTVSLHADTTLSIAAVPGSEAEIVRLLAVSLLFSSVCKMHHRNADAYILGHLLGARFAAEAVVARFEEDEILISDWIAQMTAFIAVLCGAARSPLGGSALFGTTLSVGVLLSCAATKLAVECVVFLVHRKFYAVDYEVVLRHGGLAAPFASVALGLLGAASWMG